MDYSFRACSDSQALRHTSPRDHHSSDTRLAAGARRQFNTIISYFVFVVVIFIALTVAALICVAPQSASKRRLSHTGLSRNAYHILDLDRIVTVASWPAITQYSQSWALELSPWVCPFTISCFATGVCNETVSLRTWLIPYCSRELHHRKLTVCVTPREE